MTKPILCILLIISGLMSDQQALAESLFFLRIADVGRYTVTINDQSITLSTGRYRFFELPAGQSRITIAQNNIAVYQGWVDLYADSRTVAEFSTRQGLRIVGSSPLSVDGRLWEWSYPWGGTQGAPQRPGRYDNPPVPMSAQAFDRAKEAVNKQSFDDDKYNLLVTLLTDQFVTSAQLADLLELFSFDEKRLEAAKRGWQQVTDRQNFYQVFDSFTFKTNVDKLKTFMASR